MPHTILGLIDVQPTFMPGGSLPVPGGHEILPLVNALTARHPGAFATQDWHPRGHTSFASTHPAHQPYDTITLPYGPQTLWPDHAIQGTGEANLHPALNLTPIAMILRKGANAEIDSYSAFFENDHATPTGLHGWLRDKSIGHLLLAGLATDFCVAWTASDAIALGYKVTIVTDACRAIALRLPSGETTLDRQMRELGGKGVHFQTSGQIQ